MSDERKRKFEMKEEKDRDKVKKRGGIDNDGDTQKPRRNAMKGKIESMKKGGENKGEENKKK